MSEENITCAPVRTRVIGVPSDFFGEEVAACVKLKDGATFDEAAMRAELLKSLAKYKVPSCFVVYDQLPMLGSGNIDGVPEANNAAGELYTLARKELALNQIQGRDPRSVLEGVRSDVSAFALGAAQFDDLTMLCVTYRGGEGQADGAWTTGPAKWRLPV